MTLLLMAVSVYVMSYLVFHTLRPRFSNQLWAELGSMVSVWFVLVLWAVTG